MRPEWILDAQLVGLFLLGSVDRMAIGKHRRFDAYAPADFDALENFLTIAAERHDAIVVSPNIWTEVSNLFQKDQSREDSRWARMLPILEDVIERFSERYVPTSKARTRREFRFLGLTDVVLLELASTGTTLVTKDWALCDAAGRAGVQVLHFDAIRASWDAAR